MKTYPFQQWSGDGSSTERNDCTVKALSLMLPDKSYQRAYDILHKAGRMPGKRFNFRKWLYEQKEFAVTIIHFNNEKGNRMTPAKFCQQYKAGNYILRIDKHVFAVIDGVVHDTSPIRRPGCRVSYAARFEGIND